MKIKIQPIQSNLNEPQPYPYFTDEKGNILRQDFWRGVPVRVIGFSETQDSGNMNILYCQVKNVGEIVGMYPVFQRIDKSLYTLANTCDYEEAKGV